MSQRRNSEIEGDVAIGRNLTVGGNGIVRGSATVGGNLRVDGWLDAPNVKGPAKGMFRSEPLLKERYPRPQRGWWALVGDTLPALLYIAESDGWVNTGKRAGNPEIEMEQYNEAVSRLDGRISALDDRLAALTSSKGAAGGLATLDGYGFLTLAQQRPALLDFYCKDDFSGYPTGIRRVDLRENPAGVLAVGYTADDCIVYDVATTRFCHRRVAEGVVEFRNRWEGCEAWGDLGDSGVKPEEGRLYYCNPERRVYAFSRNYGRNTHNFAPVEAMTDELQELTEGLEDANVEIRRSADSLSALQRSFDSLKAAAIVADSAGMLPLGQQRPALMDFYCKDDFSNNYSHEFLSPDDFATRLDLRTATEHFYPEEVLYTEDNCIVYDVATTRFCHRKRYREKVLNYYPERYRTVTEFRNRWVGCEAWGNLGNDGVAPDSGRAYFCNPEQQVYVFARNYGFTTSRFEPVQAMAARLAELAARINASLNPDSAGFLPLAQQRPALMDFYCKDDFKSYPPDPLPDEDFAMRIDLRTATEENYPEEVLYTPENCIVYDAASTRFCHRKIYQQRVPNLFPPRFQMVTEFRNRWIGCEAWGDLGDNGVKPDEGRLYYCNRDNTLYPFARNYGYNTHSFGPVNAGAVSAALLVNDREASDLVEDVFNPKPTAAAFLMSDKEASALVDGIFD